MAARRLGLFLRRAFVRRVNWRTDRRDLLVRVEPHDGGSMEESLRVPDDLCRARDQVTGPRVPWGVGWRRWWTSRTAAACRKGSVGLMPIASLMVAASVQRRALAAATRISF